MWVTDTRAIDQSDLRVVDPYDGSTVYPLNTVVLNSGYCVKKLAHPLRLLESRMQKESSLGVIRAADCGMLAMYANNTQLAVRALDRALALSEGAMGNESQVKTASGISGAEKNKVFAGEPHEVASLYISRGLLYLAKKDPENAKSCFLRASLVDAMAEKDESRSNWLTADVLAALSFKLYGNNVRFEDHCAMIRKTYSHVPNSNGWVDPNALAGLKGDNLTIVVVAIGNPPVKFGQGQLEYAECKSRVHSVRVMGSSAWMTDNVFVQAVTRGRRSMDSILAARQRRREDTETGASIALGVAAAAGGVVGLAIQVVAGAIIEGAHKIDVNADSRHVTTVPGQFYVWASNEPPPGRELVIELSNSTGKPIARGAVILPERQSGIPNVTLAWFPR